MTPISSARNSPSIWASSPSPTSSNAVLQVWADRPRLSPWIARELRTLSREDDSSLLGKGLLSLGRRSLAKEQTVVASEVFSWVAAEGENQGFDPSVVARAREELTAMAGQSGFGRQAESFLGQFSRQASDPAALLGMTAGSLAFSTLRFAALSRLVASPAASFWTRGVGARALASGAAFIPEVSVFWGGERLAGVLLHSERPRSADWKGEWAAAALGLGLLKLSGAGSSALFRRFHGIEAGAAIRGDRFTRLSAPLFEQAGLLTGISLAQYVQPQLALGPSHHGHFWSDAFATLLHFNVAGRLAGGQRFARELALRESRLRVPERAPRRIDDGAEAWGLLQAFQPQPIPAGSSAPSGVKAFPNSSYSESRAFEQAPASSGNGLRLREPAQQAAPPPALSPELQQAIAPILLGIRQSVDDATLHRLFADLPRGPELWLPPALFAQEQYARRVLGQKLEGRDSFEMPLIGWLDGQGSVPHDHGGSAGFEFVAAGDATVRLYRQKPDGGLVRISEKVWPEGSVIGIAPEDIHVVANQQGGGRPLVTLHAYRPFMDPARIRKFPNQKR